MEKKKHKKFDLICVRSNLSISPLHIYLMPTEKVFVLGVFPLDRAYMLSQKKSSCYYPSYHSAKVDVKAHFGWENIRV